MAENTAIEKEYKLSAKKEEEIKKCFELLKNETGVTGENEEDEAKKVLESFIELF